jgi:hypothetical protein
LSGPIGASLNAVQSWFGSVAHDDEVPVDIGSRTHDATPGKDAD